jgi:hypothetical protein
MGKIHCMDERVTETYPYSQSVGCSELTFVILFSGRNLCNFVAVLAQKAKI